MSHLNIDYPSFISSDSYHDSQETSPNHPSPHLLAPKLSICFSGQLPDGVLNVRTSFQSRPSLIALGSKANSVTKFPVFVQTYSSNQTDPDDANSMLGDRKDSTIIIASSPEDPTPQRSFDFCQVDVLLSELQLLAGILAVTFAISMHTSPSIERYYTPHWAGIPLFVSGLIGMGLRCRNWRANCGKIVLQVIQTCFSMIVGIAGAISLTAAVLSITYLNTLANLHNPSIIQLPFNERQNTQSDNHCRPLNPPFDTRKYSSVCRFLHLGYGSSNRNTSYKTTTAGASTTNATFEQQNQFPCMDFYVRNAKDTEDCENFLFNVKNYCFMQCFILLIGSVVSVIIITNTYYRTVKGKVKRKMKGSSSSLHLSSTTRKHLEKIRDFQNRTTTGVSYPSDYPEMNADCSEDTTQMDEHHFQNSSPTGSRALYSLPRFRNSKDGNMLPGVIIEDKDDCS